MEFIARKPELILDRPLCIFTAFHEGKGIRLASGCRIVHIIGLVKTVYDNSHHGIAPQKLRKEFPGRIKVHHKPDAVFIFIDIHSADGRVGPHIGIVKVWLRSSQENDIVPRNGRIPFEHDLFRIGGLFRLPGFQEFEISDGILDNLGILFFGRAMRKKLVVFGTGQDNGQKEQKRGKPQEKYRNELAHIWTNIKRLPALSGYSVRPTSASKKSSIRKPFQNCFSAA